MPAIYITPYVTVIVGTDGTDISTDTRFYDVTYSNGGCTVQEYPTNYITNNYQKPEPPEPTLEDLKFIKAEASRAAIPRFMTSDPVPVLPAWVAIPPRRGRHRSWTGKNFRKRSLSC